VSSGHHISSSSATQNDYCCIAFCRNELSILPYFYETRESSSTTEDDSKLKVLGGKAATHTPAQWVEKKMRRERKRGRRGGRRNLPNYKETASLGRQKSVSKDISSEKKKMENGECLIGKQVSTIYTIAKFSGRRTLAGLRKRHDQLEVQIKQMKEDITLQVEKAKMKTARKADGAEEEKEKEQESEMELDIFY
jgi:hypothetical protein